MGSLALAESVAPMFPPIIWSLFSLVFSQRATSECINPWNLSRRLVNLWSVAHCLKSVNLPDFSVYMVCVYDV